MKVHITLVGAQALPVYHGIVATDPDKVVYIYSKQSDKVLATLKRELSVHVDNQDPLDPTDAGLIYERATVLAERYKNDIVTVNISGGTKPWSFIFGLVFSKMPNATVVYMDQNNLLWDYRTMKKALNQNYVFDIDVLFKLQGNELRYYTPFIEYTEQDHAMVKVITKARSFNCGQFNRLTTILTKEWKNSLDNMKFGRFETAENVFVEWEKPDHVTISLTTQKYGVLVFNVDSPHAVRMTFNAGWFEYKVASLLSRWSYAKDIRMSCIFPQIEGANVNSVKFPKNEIDIVVNTGQKLLFVECKTALANSTDIDKFRTAVKNYGGLGSKAIFITENEMTPLQKEKCDESGILYFSFKNPENTQPVSAALFSLLERDLFNINAK